uniref:Uncharacterized protein n=1 Tax=Arundo donax TaxID=35708 RepID=A0A0A9E3Y1_ARUDO
MTCRIGTTSLCLFKKDDLNFTSHDIIWIACCLIFISRSWFAQTSRENCTIDVTESPRSGAGDSISSSKISKAMEATSSSPLARHCLDTFKILGTNSRNIFTMSPPSLTYSMKDPTAFSAAILTRELVSSCRHFSKIGCKLFR